MKSVLQKFGGALYTPVLFTAFAGIMAGLSIVFKDANIMGSMASEGTLWYSLWYIIGEGAWTIFRQMPLIFVVGMPIALAKKTPARASMEALLCFLTYNYYINTILTLYGPRFGVDLETSAGITQIAGITTFDMSILGAIIIALLTVYIHDKFFDKELPEFIGTFSGSVCVYVIMFFLLIPVALATVVIWPKIQQIILSGQNLILNTGTVGVGIYTFLERFLVPTGLHHLVYQPFEYGDLVVAGGAKAAWIGTIEAARMGGATLASIFPAGGYLMFGNAKVFGTLGMSLAFYATSKPEKRKRTLGLLIPITLTAILVGVTEPFEFTFIFIAPVLFFIHAVLAGIMSSIMFALGVAGDFGSGLINFATMNWLPLFKTHGGTYLIQILIGLSFTAVYFLVFKFAIQKMNLKTPGREEGEEIKFYSKKDAKNKKDTKASDNEIGQDIEGLLTCLGGEGNIVEVSNCMTRLRITLKDENNTLSDTEFKKYGAHGVVKGKKAIQVVIGLKVPNIREKLEKLIERERKVVNG